MEENHINAINGIFHQNPERVTTAFAVMEKTMINAVC